MKEHLRTIIGNIPDPLHKRNMVREYLQAVILAILQNQEAMIALGFHGGTALRFLYQLPRFSEDLDFTLEKPDAAYDFSALMKAVRNGLLKQGYQARIKINDRKTVHSALVRFEELLYEFGLSGHRDALFSIKIEVDTNPPEGVILETHVVRRYVPLHLQHHDRSSLFSGKLHCALQRPFLKGRDIYDLIWYLGDPAWPEPNFIMLANALKQTGWKGEYPDSGNWRRILKRHIENMEWNDLARDVRPFLESAGESRLLTKENLFMLLSRER